MSVALQVALYMAAREIAAQSNDKRSAIVAGFIRSLSEYASDTDYRQFVAELIDQLSSEVR